MAGHSTVTDEVIAQVKNRPVLWDKKNDMYGNIQAMDFEWVKMAGALQRDKEFLKKRWRRVRDVFRIEVKKLKVPAEPKLPLINYYTGVWSHFESMLFLKDSLSKRTPRLYLPNEIEELNDSSVQEAASPENNVIEDIDDEDEVEEKPFYVHCENIFAEEATHATTMVEENCDVTKTNDSQTERRGVKRKADADWNSKEMEYDEDINFAKSLVGYLRRLNPVRKLLVRNDIQSIFLRELTCEKCRCNGQKVCQCT